MVYSSEPYNAMPDRRVHDRVREIFAEACDLMAPMMAAVRQGYVSDFALTHIVHDHFPALSALEIEVLVMAVKRYDTRAKT